MAYVFVEVAWWLSKTYVEVAWWCCVDSLVIAANSASSALSTAQWLFESEEDGRRSKNSLTAMIRADVNIAPLCLCWICDWLITVQLHLCLFLVVYRCACCDVAAVRYRPMRGGQMTPPDVVVRGRDDQISARMAWNQVSMSMSVLCFMQVND